MEGTAEFWHRTRSRLWSRAASRMAATNFERRLRILHFCHWLIDRAVQNGVLARCLQTRGQLAAPRRFQSGVVNRHCIRDDCLSRRRLLRRCSIFHRGRRLSRCFLQPFHVNDTTVRTRGRHPFAGRDFPFQFAVPGGDRVRRCVSCFFGVFDFPRNEVLETSSTL